MRVLFLGTGAAEAVPGLFCNCEACQRARKLGGRNLRCRSSALVNDDLLIDYGPDTSAQATRHGLDLTKVRDILFTHSHLDHESSFDLWYRTQGSRLRGSLDLTHIWANNTALEKFLGQIGVTLGEQYGVKLGQQPPTTDEVREELEDLFLLDANTLRAHETLTIGNYIVHTIRANHNPPEECLNFVVDDGKVQFVYATDTGLWEVEEWEFLEGLDIQFDAVALDCTVGGDRMTGGHHSNKSYLLTKEEFENRGLLKENHLFLAHHFSHQGNFIYDDCVEFMRPYGVVVTYDGMELTLPEDTTHS